MKRYIVRNRIEILFVLLQTILYISFLTIDLNGGNSYLSNWIKFSIIILCFCFALFHGKGANKSIIFCMKAALFFTVLSDLFLLILDHYFVGVITFIIVQQLYGIRIIINGGCEYENKVIFQKYFQRFLAEVVMSFFVCIALIFIGTTPEPLLIISVFYFICILTNTVTAIRISFHRPFIIGNIIYAIGILLFLLCDINVGIFNMSGFIAMPEKLYDILYGLSSILMWTFYAPSQVMISLSTICQNEQKL